MQFYYRRADEQFGPMPWETVGAQWELRCPLARKDQRLRLHHPSVRAHLDRLFP
jgi:hypothetical protein